MTRTECPPTYFEHLTIVVHAVLTAENNLRQNGTLTTDTCKGKTAEWYCQQIAEEMITHTSPEELGEEWKELTT